jgi:hypothetical protein
MLNLFSFFHLNLAFSSIEVENHKDIIKICYWPLLKLIEETQVPIAIEASGYTLERIKQIDKEWINKLKSLINMDLCEFIGCGYAQIIAPITSSKLNLKNLEIGMDTYNTILGFKPTIGLINEQAFSKGTAQIYKKAGYKSILMEWNNLYCLNTQKWNTNYRYYKQYIEISKSSKIQVLWNNSISFQQFQRYVHGDISDIEYNEYIYKNINNENRFMCFYGNDAEIFNYRPGRYKTEKEIKDDEWAIIKELIIQLQKHEQINFCSMNDVINYRGNKNIGNTLKIENPDCPISVKKQNKYNINRWAVTGKNDFSINTRCWRIFNNLIVNKSTSYDEWKKLCYLWSSDIRTHITNKRWIQYLKNLDKFEKKINCETLLRPEKNNIIKQKNIRFKVQKFKHKLNIKYKTIDITFNLNKGLTLEQYTDNSISINSIIGTLKHGYFDDIRAEADYYSGHLIKERYGDHKVTDLVPVKEKVITKGNELIISGEINTLYGLVEKKWIINPIKKYILLEYKFNWVKMDKGSLRLGYLTLNPESFNFENVYFETHNGGDIIEKYKINRKNGFDHGASVSNLVSANSGFGMTEGILIIADNNIQINITTVKSESASIGYFANNKIGNKNLMRAYFSCMENDDTSRGKYSPPKNIAFKIEFIKKIHA